MNLHAERTDTIATYKSIDPFYFQLYGGINKSANENLPWTELTSYPISGGLFAGVGREVSDIWGWRIAFRYNHNKSRNVQECETPDTWGWDNIALFGDATLDITDVFCLSQINHNQEYRNWNLKAFAGVGIAHTFGFDNVPLSYTEPYNRNSKLTTAIRAGFTVTYRLDNNWRAGAEISHSIFNDYFNGVQAGFPYDGRTNLKLGITYMLTEKKKEIPDVEYDHRLRTVPELPFILPYAEDVKRRRIVGRAFIDFPVNETVINPYYRSNQQELKRIIATIDSAIFDKSIQVTRISLHGYASPESSYSNNVRLSRGRVVALQNYLQKHYKFNPSAFSLENTPEDWQNLRDFIAADGRKRVKGDIWYESHSIFDTPEPPEAITNNRDELLRIIDLQIDKDEKEELLKQVGNGEPYNWLLKYVYPGLRHTDYVIEYVVRHYPVKDARRLIYTHPEALSTNEMYQVANSYPAGSDGWLDALLIAAKQYPEDKTANLNAACACVKVKRLKDARHYLSAAGDTEQTQYLSNIISAMDGTAKWTMEDGRIILIP